ncbi:MAG: cupin domain-containing protein [Sediminicola sp.]|tara:strand:+ start:43111 stop:43455 length:345 start_codon:yes stop_codon:yes gene_type:complete
MKEFGNSREFLFGSEIPWETVGDGVERQILGFDRSVMMVNVKFRKGAIGPVHQHYHTQVSHVIHGKFEMTIDNVSKILEKGDSFYVPPNVPHGTICLEDGILLDVFSPLREDFM